MTKTQLDEIRRVILSGRPINAVVSLALCDEVERLNLELEKYKQ